MELAMTSGPNTRKKLASNAALPPALKHVAPWRLACQLTETNSLENEQAFAPPLLRSPAPLPTVASAKNELALSPPRPRAPAPPQGVVRRLGT